ncbi:DedA family protein [Rothia sp. P13129]|uniref:DedA family protein n=1 Tax=unclassified Rothia (in: high G+C Gram-positive bacteria) TaxID=2689056 RepID=UPI003ACFB9E3
MIEWIQSLQWHWALLFFWIVGIIRTSLVFMLGWIASAGSAKLARIRHLMQTPMYLRAQHFINRWGVLAVPLCFLTLGFQTAVILTTGFTRMSLKRWIPAMLVGTLMWACIYSTVGMAVIWAWIQQPTVLITAIILLIALSLFIYLGKRTLHNRSRHANL